MTVKGTDHISRVMIKCSISGEAYSEVTGQLEVDSVRGKYSQLRGGRLHVADIVVYFMDPTAHAAISR
jgi:hypothetical protein